MTAAHGSAVTDVAGTGIVLPGDDIDTDRIIPARYLKAITFDGLEQHVFADDRVEARARGALHVFDVPERRGAHVLIAGANFGCGSSREHAPQALLRWGIRAVVADSFAEIFAGNALMIGLPCVTVARGDAEHLRTLVDADPAIDVAIDIVALRVRAGGLDVAATMPASAHSALLSGHWDATGLLLADYDEVTRATAGIPYLHDFRHEGGKDLKA